jgi:hypothetical protein
MCLALDAEGFGRNPIIGRAIHEQLGIAARHARLRKRLPPTATSRSWRFAFVISLALQRRCDRSRSFWYAIAHANDRDRFGDGARNGADERIP